MSEQAEIDRLVHYMPILVRDGALTAWERTFCASIIAQDRRGPFRPSARQLGSMRRLVEAFERRQIAAARRERAGGLIE